RYFSEGELAGRDTGLLTREGDLFSEYWLHQDRRTLHEKYVRSGFLFAEVDVDYAIDESGANVVFRLNEGTRARVHEVRFVGNRAISDTDLRAQMSTREKDFFFGILRPGFFIEEDFRDDLLRLKAYYISHGYFDVRVELESFELSPDKTELYLTIRIDEGPVYTFRGYRFSGNAVFTEQTLLSLTVAEPGTPYHRDTIERDRKAIESYYADRAYVFARVNPEPEFSMSPAEVWVRLDIQEENQIHIGEIKIQNNERTKDDVIRRELRIYPGELVNNSKMIESRSNLARLGIFRDITFSYEGTGARRDVIVRVEEERSGQLIVGFGVTSGFGIIGNISITKRNFDITDWPESIYDLPDHFTGAGQTLHLVIQPGTRRSLYRATFIEPYIFGTKNELSLSA
ncbi:MAG TPA: POTRA domain-containing protein, partial [Planctomycetota bacterium]|nr:POTRA domain-containing protein [Planctomycetota bacterium]